LTLIASLYMRCLWCYPLVSHPVISCLLLIISSLSISFFSFFSAGHAWYVILFLLVYLGAVYVLFIFVSVIKPNSVYWHRFNIVGFCVVWFLLRWFFFGFDFRSLGYRECRELVCSSCEGYSYVVLCLVLMVGFLIISLIFSNKSSFYR